MSSGGASHTAHASVAAMPGLGQVVTATIYGTVLDKSGAAVPGAKVIATNAGTGASSLAATDEAGEFTIASLQAGGYTLDVEAQGFKVLRRSGIDLASGVRVRLNLSLELGAVTETVSVTAQGAGVATTTTAHEAHLDSQQVAMISIRPSAPLRV